MLTKQLPFPCPLCGGIVLSNGECECKACHHIWEGTDYTSPQLQFYGDVLDKVNRNLDSIRAEMENKCQKMDRETQTAKANRNDFLEYLQLNGQLTSALLTCERVMGAMQSHVTERILADVS